MDRRTLLRGTAALLAGGGLAGCTGVDGEVPVTAAPPPPGLRGSGGAGGGEGSTGSGGSPTAGQRAVTIEDFDALEAEDGTLVATMTVANVSDERQVRLARAVVSIDDAETVAEEFVALDPGETERVRLSLDVGYRAWMNGGSYVPELVRRTPATPLPTDTPTPTATADGTERSPTPTAGGDTRSESGTGAATDSPTEPADTTGSVIGTADN